MLYNNIIVLITNPQCMHESYIHVVVSLSESAIMQVNSIYSS